MMLTMASPPHEPESKQFLEAQLQATLNVIPAYTWYANPSGGLTFVNKRQADYLGLPKEHPLRSGIDTGAAWDSHLTFLHPGDQEYTRRIWSECLRAGSANTIAPTGKLFETFFTTIAKWKNDQIVEEYVMLDPRDIMKQVVA